MPIINVEDKHYEIIKERWRKKKPAPLRLPVEGEVARESHVTAAFQALKTLSTDTQEVLGETLLQAQEVEENISSNQTSLRAQLAYLRNEIDFWRIQRGRGTGDTIIFEEIFSPNGLTLDEEPTGTESRINHIKTVEFRNLPVTDSKLPSPYYTFGRPFASEVVDPVVQIKSGTPFRVQGTTLKAREMNDPIRYLMREFENPNNLIPINRTPRRILWYQDFGDADFSLSGSIIIRFPDSQPVSLSFVQVDMTPKIIQSVSLFDPYRKETKLPGATLIRFTPMLVQEIQINLKDTVDITSEDVTPPGNARKIAIPLEARIIATDQGAFVYYIDVVAKSLRENAA